MGWFVARFLLTSASRIPSAIAELLVFKTVQKRLAYMYAGGVRWVLSVFGRTCQLHSDIREGLWNQAIAVTTYASWQVLWRHGPRYFTGDVVAKWKERMHCRAWSGVVWCSMAYHLARVWGMTIIPSTNAKWNALGTYHVVFNLKFKLNKNI